MADVYSAFQKYVRRGDVDNALYWGAQIGRPFPNALKKRLLQHALEDVGHIAFALRLLGEVKKPTWEALVPWVQTLCALPKTRAGAWMNRVAVDYVGDVDSAPDAVLKSAAQALVYHRDEKKAELETLYGKDVMRLYREVNDDVLAFHVTILTRAGVINPAALPAAKPPAVEVDLDTPREIPDWVFDKHTARGKALGRGYAHFLETMLVAPRLFEVDPFETAARALYTNGKEQRVRHILAETKTKTKTAAPAPAAVAAVGGAGAPAAAAAPVAPTRADIVGYTDFLQTQPITGRTKPRVWFATEESTGKQVVIKGPVPLQERFQCLKTEVVKKALGLPHTNLHSSGSFLIQDCLLDYKKLETRVVSTKLESNLRVPVAASVPGWEHDMLRDEEMAYKILEALLFRKVVGANDTCTRNFIVLDRIVYSIDDAALGVDTPLMWKTGLIKPRAAYETALTKSWDRLIATMERWRGLLADNAFALKQLDKYNVMTNWKWA